MTHDEHLSYLNTSPLLKQITRYARHALGPDAARFVVLVLVVLAGRMGKKVLVRTVGKGFQQDVILRSLRNLLARTCGYKAWLAEPMMATLSFAGQVACLVWDAGENKRIVQAGVIRWSRGQKPVPDKKDWVNSDHAPAYSLILLRADGISRDDIGKQAVTLGFWEHREAVQHHARRQFGVVSDEAHVDMTMGEQELDHVTVAVDGIRWQTPVTFGSAHTHCTGLSTEADFYTIEFLYALAGACALLRKPPADGVDCVAVDVEDLNYVVRLLSDADAKKTGYELTAQAITFMGHLQKVSAAQAGQACRSCRVVTPSHFPNYTIPELQQTPLLCRHSQNTLYYYLRELEDCGLVERCGKDNKAHLWRLTAAGAEFEQATLSDILSRYLERGRFTREKSVPVKDLDWNSNYDESMAILIGVPSELQLPQAVESGRNETTVTVSGNETAESED